MSESLKHPREQISKMNNLDGIIIKFKSLSLIK
jgi:hypothetical protein